MNLFPWQNCKMIVLLQIRFRNVIDDSCSTLVKNCSLYKAKISVLFSLNLAWKQNEPKETKIECDSFVLSLDILGDNILVGLNNGCIQGTIISN